MRCYNDLFIKKTPNSWGKHLMFLGLWTLTLEEHNLGTRSYDLILAVLLSEGHPHEILLLFIHQVLGINWTQIFFGRS